MSSSEQQITKIEDFRYHAQFSGYDNYDLYLTDKRMIFIKSFKAQYAPVGGAVISEVAFHFGKRKAQKKEQETKDMTLDEKLQKIKGSFAIVCEDISEIRMRESAYLTSEININLANSKVKHFLTGKDQIEKLSNALTKVATFQGKIYVSK
ncbi:MAG: hypothetical protein ABSF65_00445 [Candidatus Bathyarchaeia archaeon]|jgi:DNA repair ATPase RecN